MPILSANILLYGSLVLLEYRGQQGILKQQRTLRQVLEVGVHSGAYAGILSGPVASQDVYVIAD